MPYGACGPKCNLLYCEFYDCINWVSSEWAALDYENSQSGYKSHLGVGAKRWDASAWYTAYNIGNIAHKV